MSYSKESPLIEPIKLSFHEKALCYIFIFLILYMGIMPFGLLGIFTAAI
jgi:hypothetical protein